METSKTSVVLRGFIRRTGTLGLGLWMLIFAAPGSAVACERCFGAGSDSPVVTALGLSMLSLAVVTGFVLTGVTKFFRDMTLRAKKLEEAGYKEGVSEN